MNGTTFHKPVLVDQVLKYLIGNPSGIYVDGTVGGGGHSIAILRHLNEAGLLIGIDWDEEAITHTVKKLQNFGKRALIKKGNYAQLTEILNSVTINHVDGILLDLGLSSHQIDTSARGFSYMAPGPLDMRMSADTGITATEIINSYPEQDLASLFKTYSEERRARNLAKAIVRERQKQQITTSQQLVKIIESVVPFPNRIKSLARIFQALRIAVNNELENLQSFLNQSLNLLTIGGRLVVISYHSLEDRLVKNFLAEQHQPCECPPRLPVCVCGKQPTIRWLTRRVVTANEAEIQLNPRSRSAKLRAAEKI